MTYLEIYQQETESMGSRIILHKEGLFWKAYEYSAYVICRHIRSFKTSSRICKCLSGQSMVSIGFPESSLEKTMTGFRCISNSEKLIVYDSDSIVIDISGYSQWKSDLLPVSSVEKVCAAEEKYKGEENEIIRLLRDFEISSSTPLEAMLFVSELKSKI